MEVKQLPNLEVQMPTFLQAIEGFRPLRLCSLPVDCMPLQFWAAVETALFRSFFAETSRRRCQVIGCSFNYLCYSYSSGSNIVLLALALSQTAAPAVAYRPRALQKGVNSSNQFKSL